MENAIAISGLHKSFGRTKALDGLDLQVPTGEVHGFLGPNGAGKSTTVRVLLGLLHADSGDVRLLGGDPWMEATFQYAIQEEREQGRTVLLSSHILAEVEALCDKVSIIRNGRTVESGTLADLRHLTRTSITAELAGPPNGLTQLANIHDLRVEGNRVRFDVETRSLDDALRQLTQVGVRSLVSQPPTLEELFLRHYTTEASAK